MGTQGRIIFDNLKKSISYSLGKCMGQVFPFVFRIALGMPLPLTPLLLMCIDAGTDLIQGMSLCMEQQESDIMKRRPRDANKEHLATLKLIFNTHLVYGILGAMAGFYGYFTVLHVYGFTPSHIVHELDNDSIFSFEGDWSDDALRDGYYLWCFKLDISEKCYYFPHFYNGTLVNTKSNEIGFYYDQNQWFLWQMNENQYAKDSKQYLLSINSSLTLNQLNGRDSNGVQCCNEGINGSQCVQPVGSQCNQDYLNWNTFYVEYWNKTILDTFNENAYTSPLFPTRRCWEMDYFSLYSQFKNQPIPSCNFFDHQYKARTYPGLNSLFP